MKQTLAAMLLGVSALSGIAHATAVSLATRVNGHINYVATGGSLRTQSNSGDPCALATTSTQALSGIPAGATVTAAYLYWGGSGSTVDATVTLNGNTINASRTFTDFYVNGASTLNYFGGFANVTALVTTNGSFTFGGLTVTNTGAHCTSAAVVSGWSLIVVYRLASEPLRTINIYDGLQPFRGGALTLTPTGFQIPASSIDGKMTVVTWEGDPENSDPLNGFSESLQINGNTLDDGIVPANSVPTVQQYDGTINTLGLSNTYGVDVDTYNVTPYLTAGQTSVTTNYSAGADLVLLAAQVVSITSSPLVNLALSKTHSGNFTAGVNGSFALNVSNAAGGDDEVNTVTVTDTLPAGLGYVSGAGTGWSCSAAGQVISCTHAPTLAAGATLPTLTLTVSVGVPAYPAATNTAVVSSASFDSNSANNTASDTVTVISPVLLVQKTSEVLSDPVNNAVNPKRIPGSIQRYSVTVTNTGTGVVDASSLVITDVVPANTSMYVSTASGNPVEFINGAVVSGLTFNYATNVSYSNQVGGGAPFTYAPTADANGVDTRVTGVRIAPSGTMAAAAGASQPAFTIRFRVRVN
jgi:uncharacterized repeat protein (TIGR01451 family)